MKKIYVLLPMLLWISVGLASMNPYWDIPSQSQVAILRETFATIENDTIKMYISRDLGFYYEERDYDSSLYFFKRTQELAIKLNQNIWEAEALAHIGFSLSPLGFFPDALKAQLGAQSILTEGKKDQNTIGLSRLAINGDYQRARKTIECMSVNYMGIMYVIMDDNREAFRYYREAEKLAKELQDPSLLSWVYMNLGEAFGNVKMNDSSLYYNKLALMHVENADRQSYSGFILDELGKAYMAKGNYDSAELFFRKSIYENKTRNIPAILAWAYIDFANLFMKIGAPDSTIYYANKGRELFYDIQIPNGLLYAYETIRKHYEGRNLDSAYFYSLKAKEASAKVTSVEKQSMLRSLNLDSQIKLEKLEKEKLQLKNRNRILGISGITLIIFIIAFILYRNNKQKQHANQVLEKTLKELRTTQKQLIQSEKMASLGELTAGIAHEIQNPLNFVNNFSEVSNELIDEMTEELKKGDVGEGLIIADDIRHNIQKIHHHGQRASGIVKGMLEHSRTSDGKKELTNINDLADEYLRLAYHGIQAKDNSFNAEYKLGLEESLPKVNVVPQDIGRVLLNLINNAFYAVAESSRLKAQSIDYRPKVMVTTQFSTAGGGMGEIIISIKDNGPGIPEEIREKIFQPFFTTKPTGQGTGLGLSLSYDIVTKGHGGTIEVKSETGKGTQFIVKLPVV
jgi:signal transduction histidine kinase